MKGEVQVGCPFLVNRAFLEDQYNLEEDFFMVLDNSAETFQPGTSSAERVVKAIKQKESIKLA